MSFYSDYQRTSAAVESNDDRILQAIEDANLAIDDADTEARYSVTRADVLERISETFTTHDDKVFMRALRQGDKQSMSLLITQITDAFTDVVRVKRDAILAKAVSEVDAGDRH